MVTLEAIWANGALHVWGLHARTALASNGVGASRAQSERADTQAIGISAEQLRHGVGEGWDSLLDELTELFVQTGLRTPKFVFYNQPMSLERLIKGSFPKPGDEQRVRQIIIDDVDEDELGLESSTLVVVSSSG